MLKMAKAHSRSASLSGVSPYCSQDSTDVLAEHRSFLTSKGTLNVDSFLWHEVQNDNMFAVAVFLVALVWRWA